MFERIQRCTAVKKYLKEHPGTTQQEALAACKAEKFQGGIKLAPKDLRDYFGTVVAGRISDPNALMRLMRHASLNTSPNLSPIEKNKAALRGIKVVSPNSYAQGEERPYGNTVYTRTNGISATGASWSDREI